MGGFWDPEEAERALRLGAIISISVCVGTGIVIGLAIGWLFGL